MHQYYTRKNEKGELEEDRISISHEELMELLRPHIAPDGFEVVEWENRNSGYDIRFRRVVNGEPPR